MYQDYFNNVEKAIEFFLAFISILSMLMLVIGIIIAFFAGKRSFRSTMVLVLVGAILIILLSAVGYRVDMGLKYFGIYR